MDAFTKKTAAVVLLAAVILAASCAPLTADESEADKAYYERIYADEPEPSAKVAALLDVLDTCVGGQYVIGGQATPVTKDFIDRMYVKYPDYFSDGRLEYLYRIAENAEKQGFAFPEDYAWDCSGLWWYAANEAGLYGEYTDKTANDTYYDDCTPIEKKDLKPGDLVFMMGTDGHVSHMGIVGRHGYIYEAVGGFAGVVLKRTVGRRIYKNIVSGGVLVCPNWNAFGRPKIFE